MVGTRGRSGKGQRKKTNSALKEKHPCLPMGVGRSLVGILNYEWPKEYWQISKRSAITAPGYLLLMTNYAFCYSRWKGRAGAAIPRGTAGTCSRKVLLATEMVIGI